MSEIRSYRTGNSRTEIKYDDRWRVLDLGSGHNPHPRADVLVDKFLLDDPTVSGRSGREVEIPAGKTFIVGDVKALPFKDKAFDFIVCSHVAEHIEDVDNFCREMIRVSEAGYIETPSKFAEVLRHPPYHIWYVSAKKNLLKFQSIPPGYPLKWFGKAFFSFYFYKSVQLDGKDVFSWAHGVPQPFDKLFLFTSRMLRRLWLRAKPITYTRFFWQNSFKWTVFKD